MDRVSVSSLNGPLSVDSPQTMTVMRRRNRSLRRRSLCSTARALAALAISLRQKSDATSLAQWSVNRKDPWSFVENVLLVENWLPAACPVDHANNAAHRCSRLRTQG